MTTSSFKSQDNVDATKSEKIARSLLGVAPTHNLLPLACVGHSLLLMSDIMPPEKRSHPLIIVRLATLAPINCGLSPQISFKIVMNPG